jgi:hypothetical protein
MKTADIPAGFFQWFRAQTGGIQATGNGNTPIRGANLLRLC